MDDLKIDYVEFSSGDIAASKGFFAQAFGWGFVDYGPQYQAFADAGIDGGIDGSGQAAVGTALVILKALDLEAALARVKAAGGVVTKPVFGFPGGRRFHFREPGGAEIGVWSER
jgi:predicted enzyme related to lactoylglutathione lyase